MDVSHSSSDLDAIGLRERTVKQQARSASEAKETVQELNTEEQDAAKPEKDKKTFGRTPDGTGRYRMHRLIPQCNAGKAPC